MEILEKVTTNPEICSVEIAFQGGLLASDIPEWQPFYNATMMGMDFSKTHIGLASVSFGEESNPSPAGPIYTQVVTFRFPSTDKNRSERIALLSKARFIKLKLTNGLDLAIGRNDLKQNAIPKIKIETNIKTAQAKFEVIAMSPAGFITNNKTVEMPQLIPLILI